MTLGGITVNNWKDDSDDHHDDKIFFLTFWDCVCISDKQKQKLHRLLQKNAELVALERIKKAWKIIGFFALASSSKFLSNDKVR